MENTAELDRLQRESLADSPDLQNAAGETQNAAGSVESQGLARLVSVGIAKGAVMRWQVLEPVLNNDWQEQSAGYIAPLLEKYGIQAEFMNRYDLEIRAAIFFGGSLYACLSLIRAENAKAQNDESKPDDGGAVSAS